MFFTKLPKYAANFTDLNCGHMAVYFAALHLKAERIHMWMKSNPKNKWVQRLGNIWLGSIKRRGL